MKFQIELINVTTTVKPTKKGSYIQLDVAYKRVDTGKVEGKKVLSFASKEAFAALKDAQQGNVFTVTAEKNEESGFWEWTNVTPDSVGTTGSAAPATKGSPTPKNTYETSEERAKKQVMIVRQSSLSNAIQTLAVNPGKDKIRPEDVLELADIYFDWVMENNFKQKDIGFDDMDDDIPL